MNPFSTKTISLLRPKIFAFALLLTVMHGTATAQTTRNVATYAELTAAVTASVDNDIINITNNIVVSAQVVLNKTLIINGNDYYITVPNNGITDAGIQNASPSTFRVFEKTDATKTVTINNLDVKGGNIQGGCINITAGIMRLNNCTISNGRNSAGAGGGIFNAGTAYLNGCKLIRNSATYGGGFRNNGTAYVDNSTFAENRSEGSAGGGGAVEVISGTTMYINNSTFSNNKSTEIGGAINVFQGTVWVINSTFSGNIGYGTTTAGGAIGVNNGIANIINSLFAYNYVRNAGTAAAPTGFALDDVSKYSGSGTINSYYNIFQGSVAAHNSTVSNIAYTGAANGSDNTIFSNGILTRITNGVGNEIGTGEVFQPFLVNSAGGIAGTLQPGSFVLNAGNRGTRTGYSNATSPVTVGYYNGVAWVALQNTSPQTYEVTTDQLAATRSTPTARGAVEAVVTNVYMLKVNTATGGSVSGGSLYGDIYTSGTNLTVTAFPNAGQLFVRWDYVVGGTGTASTSNPYSFTLTQNTTLVPVFTAATGGNYTVTYIGNGNTTGTPPAPQTTNAATTVATKGSMARPGYTFNNWNTNSNGSGTSYAENQAYSSGSNLTLYAQWTQSSTLPVTWLSFTAQPANDKVVLNWSTAAEFNSKDFTIQHSTDGSNWTAIGTQTAAGNSNNINTYSFTHTKPVAGLNQYRLLQTDIDGKSSYSKIAVVTFATAAAKLKVYPNPVLGGQVTIVLPKAAIVKIYNATGVLVSSTSLGAGQQTINTSRFAKGRYTVQAADETIGLLIQ